MKPHKCTENCKCPEDGTKLLYNKHRDEHSCQDIKCKYGYGMETKMLEIIFRKKD